MTETPPDIELDDVDWPAPAPEPEQEPAETLEDDGTPGTGTPPDAA